MVRLAGAGGGKRRHDGSGGGTGNFGTKNQPRTNIVPGNKKPRKRK